ncbi:hypothetical protein PSTG_08432 [Puccinia striiformis f. sp. tritici PST-78]|uniref:Uncharacterized protein n=1 Tax=Puccinia striiformis f. sp. tritici PST-78 TaxID=1165861 RepID=A0A0L0VGL0_9BASI|nr:hypothetical protein PSTG_08432 [Puccinia striiformis f. sp. tritici PST-78]
MARSSTSPFPTPSQPPSRRSTRLRTPAVTFNLVLQVFFVKLAALNYRKLANGNNLRSVLLQKKPLSNKNQKHGNGIKEHRRLATMNLI